MDIFKIFDNLHENKFFVLNKGELFYLIPNDLKNLVYISDNKDEFQAIFQFESDDPINNTVYLDLVNKFLMCENFYLGLNEKVLGSFEFTANKFYKISPVRQNTHSFTVEEFLELVKDKLREHNEQAEANKKKKGAAQNNINENMFDELLGLDDFTLRKTKTEKNSTML